MTILLDRPRWSWRGQLWAHLVSDHDPDELHAFAAAIGIRRLRYQGDHYDVADDRWDRAVAAGAQVVDSRELVRRLREAGLRHRGSMRWSIEARWNQGDPTGLLGELDGVGLPTHTRREIAQQNANARVEALIVLRRTAEWGLGITTSGPPEPPLAQPPRRWVTIEGQHHHVDWFVSATDRPPDDAT